MNKCSTCRQIHENIYIDYQNIANKGNRSGKIIARQDNNNKNNNKNDNKLTVAKEITEKKLVLPSKKNICKKI